MLKNTRSICSTCGEIVPAVYEVGDNEQVFFTRTCLQHGTTDLGQHWIASFDSGLPYANDLGLQTGERVPLEDLVGPAVVVDVTYGFVPERQYSCCLVHPKTLKCIPPAPLCVTINQ